MKLQKLCLHSSLIACSVLGNQNILPFTADFPQEMVLETQSFEGVALYTILLLKQGASAAACVCSVVCTAGLCEALCVC